METSGIGNTQLLAAVSVQKKSNDLKKELGDKMLRLIEQSGPQSVTPPPGSTISVYA